VFPSGRIIFASFFGTNWYRPRYHFLRCSLFFFLRNNAPFFLMKFVTDLFKVMEVLLNESQLVTTVHKTFFKRIEIFWSFNTSVDVEIVLER